VKEAVVERVREAAAELGYHPNEAARGLRSAQTMTLGVVLYQLRQLPMLEFLEGFGAVAEEAGYAMLMANARGSDEQCRALIARLFERRVDGLLVAAPGELGDALKPYTENHVPAVAGMSRGSLETHIPLVMTSEFAAVQEAVRRLKELGHSSVVFVGTPRSVVTPRPAYLTRAAAECGMTCQMVFLPETADMELLAPHIAQVMEPPTNATALIINYTFVGAFMNAVRSLGMSIPGDVSVLTFSDYRPTDAFLNPPLSSIHSDVITLGNRAAEILIGWVESGEAPPMVTDLGLSSWHETASVGPAPVRVASRS
jgi:LacI family transcriptional regulator